MASATRLLNSQPPLDWHSRHRAGRARIAARMGLRVEALDARAPKAFARGMSESSRLVVHHLEHSRSLRVLWLLEELDLPYDIRRYARDTNFRAPPELKAVHPLGRSPVVE